MALIGSIAAALGGILGGGAAAGTSSALMSALTAATSTGASAATAAGTGSALTSAITAATATGAGAATTAGTGSALTGAITAATGGGASVGSAGGTAAGGITAAGIGKAATVGAVKGSLFDAGITAAQGGSTEDILKAGATGAATGAVSGATSGLLSGVKTGTTVQIGGTKLTAPGVSSGSNLKAGSVQIGSKSFTAPGSVQSEILGTKAINTPTTIPGMPATGLPIPPAKTSIASKVANSKVGQGALKAAGQFGVQGALSLLSMGAAAKQADAANQVSQQSLLFQKQTYEEQKAEKESFKTSMKQSAQTAYDSALLFGSTLKDSDSNSSLLTSYSTGGTGDYSILTYSSSRSRDKT